MVAILCYNKRSIDEDEMMSFTTGDKVLVDGVIQGMVESQKPEPIRNGLFSSVLCVNVIFDRVEYAKLFPDKDIPEHSQMVQQFVPIERLTKLSSADWVATIEVSE